MKTWEEILGIKEGNPMTPEGMIYCRAVVDLLKQAESEGLIAINLPSEEEIRKLIDCFFAMDCMQAGIEKLCYRNLRSELTEAISDRIKKGGKI